MRLKLLLFLLFVSSGILRAQDTIKYLIFSEVRMDENRHTYVELTNMGDKSVDLSLFELGTMTPWNNPIPWTPDAGKHVMLPKKMLDPGKSFVVAEVYDYRLEQSLIDPEKFSPQTKKEMWNLADMQIHIGELGGTTDSVSTWNGAIESWHGRSCFYLRQHLSATDSVVVDAVNPTCS